MEVHIKELLYQNDRVVIPDFGAFLTRPAPAQVHPSDHTFRPASKQVTFNERIKDNDGLLVSAVANHHKLQIDEAVRRVQEYVYDVKQQLKAHNRYEVAGVGTLFINPQFRLEFEASPQVNFNEESFGLPELQYKPVLRGRGAAADPAPARVATPVVVPSAPRRATAGWLYLLLAGMVLLVVGAYLIVFTPTLPSGLSRLNPFAVFEEAAAPPVRQEPRRPEVMVPADVPTPADEATPADVTIPPVQPPANDPTPPATRAKADDPAPPAPAATPPATRAKADDPAPTTGQASATSRTKRYHLIAGGFSVAANAERLKRTFTRDALQVTVIAPYDATNLYKVSVASYATADEARLGRQELMDRYQQDFWILKY